MFFKDSVVVITAERPVAASENVLGRLGVVIETTEDGGEMFYDVMDVTGSEYAYDETELRAANDDEIKLALINILKRRI